MNDIKKYNVQIRYSLESVTGHTIFAPSREYAAAIGKAAFIEGLKNPENYKNVEAIAKEMP